MPLRSTCFARRLLAAVLSAVLSAGAVVRAQGFTATLVGTVADPSGAPVAEARLIITNTETGLTGDERSRGNGEFTVTSLPPGRYRLTVEAAGFRTFQASDLSLDADQVRRMDVRLEVGSVQERVEVVAGFRTLNTETPAKSQVVPNALIQALPLNGRNYLDLSLIVPGVYRRVGDDDSDAVATNGTRWDATGFNLDGVLNRSDRNGDSGVALTVDAVREFDAQTSTYVAEYGRNAGAQINVVTKSGTNRFGGSLFEYVRDDAFDARNPFAPPGEDSSLTRHQGGGSVGGPIHRDRTFFFASFERTRERRSREATSTAPNAAWLTGDFRNVRGAGANGRLGDADDTNRILNPLTKAEFATPNVIPPSMFDATATQMLPFIPAANLPGTLEGYAAQGDASDDHQQFLMKVDHRLSGTGLSLRWARSWGTGVDPFPSDRVFYPGFAQNTDQQADSVMLSATTHLSGRFVNDARAGYFREELETAGEQSDTNWVGQFGLPGLSQDPSVWGFPTVRIDGYADFGDRPNSPTVYTLQNYQFIDTITWTPDRHTVKAGADIVQSRYQEKDLRGIRGDFRFRGRATNTSNNTSSGFRSFADFLLGQIDQSARQVGSEPARLSGWQTAVFVQDDWRIRPSLTISLGLRYEWQTPLAESADRLANFVPDLGAVVVAGDPRFPASLVRMDDANFAPRAGFAWRPGASGRTVVRGGGGVYYSLEAFNITRQQLAVSYPFVLREQYTRTTNVPVTFSNPFPSSLAATQGVNAPLGMAVDYRTPEIYQYNLTVERELSQDLALEVGYVGSQGRYLGRRYNLNQPIPVGLLPDGTLGTVRPYPQFADIQFQDQTISSSYNALQTGLRRRMAGGLTMLVSYTLGKSIDSGSNSAGNLSNVSTTGAQKAPQDIYNMRAERGVSDFDRRHQFSGAFAYDLPFGEGRRWASDNSLARLLAGGWQVSGIVTVWSGRPFTPQYSAGDFATQRPNLVSDPMANIPAGLWFNPNAFARPVATAAEPDLYGNAGRNILTGPDYQNVDVALSKTMRAGPARVEFRAEAFNLLNRANYDVPVFLLDASNVGQVTATQGDARQLQFALRVLF